MIPLSHKEIVLTQAAGPTFELQPKSPGLWRTDQLFFSSLRIEYVVFSAGLADFFLNNSCVLCILLCSTFSLQRGLTDIFYHTHI